jgi:hypothetical protein
MDRKNNRVLIIMKRWVKGEMSTAQADRELKIAGVKLPKGGKDNA